MLWSIRIWSPNCDFFCVYFFFWLSPFISQASLQLLILSLLSLGITGMHLPLAQSCWWFSLTEVLPSLLRILISFTLCLIWSRNIPQVFMRFLSLIFKITFIYLFWVCTCVCVCESVHIHKKARLPLNEIIRTKNKNHPDLALVSRGLGRGGVVWWGQEDPRNSMASYSSWIRKVWVQWETCPIVGE